MEDYLKKLYEEAEELAGRSVEVEKTRDGKYIVMWMSFSSSPPPKGDSVEDALSLFIGYLKEGGKAVLEKEGEEL